PGGHSAADEAHREQRAHGDPHAVPRDELPRAVGNAVPARQHGETVEVALEVLGELLRRRVAPGGLLAERTQHDLVEVAGELLAAPVVDARARPLRLLLADRAHDLEGRGAAEPIGRKTDEEL